MKNTIFSSNTIENQQFQELLSQVGKDLFHLKAFNSSML